MTTDSTTPAATEVYVGVDVSKARLDAWIDPTGRSLSVDNTPAGIQSLCFGRLGHGTSSSC